MGLQSDSSNLEISSRPLPLGGSSSGIQLQCSDEELELITALLCLCRLGGKSVHNNAAYQLLQKVDAIKGYDFSLDVVDNVTIHFTIEDSNGLTLLDSRIQQFDVTIEV